MSISDYFEKRLLKALKNETSAVAEVFVKLHKGDPGEAGTENAATEATRKKVASWTGENPLKSNAAVEWINVSTTEEYSHISLWDAESAGNCLWSGALTAKKAVSAGDNFILAKEALEVSLD